MHNRKFTKYFCRSFLLWLAISVCVVGSACSGADTWRVQLDRSDLTDAAGPVPVGDRALVDATRLGPLLGVSVLPEDSDFILRGADGTLWKWNLTTGFLSSEDEGKVIPLPTPGLQQGTSLFLDPEPLAELANLDLKIDESAKKITFSSRNGALASQQVILDESIGDGWQSFTIPKPKSEKPQRYPSALSTAAVASAKPPPGRDRLDFRLGIGHVQHADWGMEISASGKAGGGNTNFWAMVTRGDEGLKLKNSHFSWIDWEAGRGFEGGDLYSESWGLVRGLRYTWDAGRRRWPSIGLYLKNERTENHEALVSYRDELQLGPDTWLRGELGSDESAFLTLRYGKEPFEIFAFGRHLPDKAGEGKGIFASYSFAPRLSVFYGHNSYTDSIRQRSTTQSFGVRLPLLEKYSLVLDQTEYDRTGSSQTSRSVGLTVPLADSINLYLRYQRSSSETDSIAGRLVNIRNTSSSMMTSLSLSATPEVHLSYQMSTYSSGGRSTNYEQLVTNYRISPRANLQMISGFPNIADTNLLRLRLDQQLGGGMSAIVDYGRLAPYQRAANVSGRRGFMVMLRKTWPLSVPARGGRIEGTVTDQLGQPAENIIVELGPYSTLTDKNGRYVLEGIPTGTYKIGIADESVPADYNVGSTAQEIKVKRGTREKINFTLVPLGSITGMVYLDKNKDGKYDEGEGVANIAVCANGLSTATTQEGHFGFYNLEAGHYTVRVAEEALDKQYVVNGNGAVEVDLQPKASVTGIELRIQRYEKPIRFASLH